MRRKNITIDLEAYDRLVQARRFPTESFSEVIKRAEWRPAKTAGDLLKVVLNSVPLSDEILDQLERNQKTGKPPRDKWNED